MSAINTIIGDGTVTFTVPGVSGNYAPERLTFRATGDLGITTMRPTIESALPSGTILEVWVLKYEGDPDVDADYTFNANVISGAALTGFSSPYARAIQIRAKSGATSGSVTVHAVAI